MERDHVLAACVHVEDGCASGRILRVPTDELKAVAIREVIGRPVDAVFGNSIHDYAMLEMAKWPFCVNPNPDLQKAGGRKGMAGVSASRVVRRFSTAFKRPR